MKKLFPLLIASLITLLLSQSAFARHARRPAQDTQSPPVQEVLPESPGSCILLDMDTGRVLFERNSQTPNAPASLTKILTMLIALDDVAAGKHSLTDTVVISPAVAATGESTMGLAEGEPVSLGDLLTGMAVASANDASLAVAEFLAGSASAFVERMNETAKAIGMKTSTFINPNGLPGAGQTTTAADMAILARTYLTRHPETLATYHSRHFMRHGKRVSWPHNPLLGNLEGADGLKTGWTKAAGYNLIGTALRGNQRLLCVILGASDAKIRAVEGCRLLESGFASLAQGIPFEQALQSFPPEKFSPDLNLLRREALTYYHVVPSRKATGARKARGHDRKVSHRKDKRKNRTHRRHRS